MTSDFFTQNRSHIAQTLKEPVILVANAQMQASADAAFRFQQEATFYWATGINAPGWMLIIDGETSTLVAPNVSESHALFDGNMTHDEVLTISGATRVISRGEYKDVIAQLAQIHDTVYTLGKDPHEKSYGFYINPAQNQAQKVLEGVFKQVNGCRSEIAKLRAIKQPAEIDMIQTAVNLTVQGFKHMIMSRTHYNAEYQVEADFTHLFRYHNAIHAYDPIVASGVRACTLHYIDNATELENNSLVLVDIGARINGYAADITRTYAIGTPSSREIAVHKAVETAHHKIIQLIEPGFKFAAYQAAVDEVMKDALLEVGLLKDKADEKTYRKYFPHAISHGLGLDVHESLGGFGEFKPGMVLTVEPGIYIPEEGIGVRIEDDILVTETGHTNLSADLPTAL